MSEHKRTLQTVITRIAESNPDCGIVVQGSVAAGNPRPDSDIDIYVVTATERPVFCEFIQSDNRGAMKYKGPVDGINIDIGWQDVETLVAHLEQDGAAGWFVYSRGTIAHDPEGHAERCMTVIHQWFAEHPAIAKAWSDQHERVQRRKVEPDYSIEYPTFHAFYRHVCDLLESDVR